MGLRILYLIPVLLLGACNVAVKSSITAGKFSSASACQLQLSSNNPSSIILNFEVPKHVKSIKLFRDGAEIFATSDSSVTTFIDTGLVEGLPYTYSCQTTNPAGIEFLDPDSILGYTKIVNPPVFGGILNATDDEYYSSDISWGAPGGGAHATKYHIYISTGPIIDFTANPAYIIPTSDNINSFTLENLLPDTEYTFGVKACTYNNVCDINTTTLTRTTVGFKDCNLATTAIDSSNIKIDFAIPSFFKSFKLLRDGAEVFSTTNLSTNTYTDTGLAEGRPYTYSCEAVNELDDVVTDPVTIVGYTTISTPPVFAGISNAIITSVTSAKSFWGETTGGSFASKYLVYVNEGATVDFLAAPYATISHLDNAGEESIGSLVIGTQYAFGVRACTHTDLCDSNTVSITRTIENDVTSPTVDPLSISIVRDATAISDAGITTSVKGKAWDLSVVASDNSGIGRIKIFRKLSTSGNDFPAGSELVCVDDEDTNCLVSNTQTETADWRDINVDNDSILYVNYRVEVYDGFGNLTTATKSFNAQYPVQIAAGDNHSCALFNHGGVWCWGRGEQGQLGYSGRANLSSGVGTAGHVKIVDATNDPDATKVIKIAAKSNRTCAVLDNGKVKCWGHGRYLTHYPSNTGPNTTGSGWGVSALLCSGCAPTWSYAPYFYNSTLDNNSLYDIISNTSLEPKDIASYEIHAGEEIESTEGFDISDNIQCGLVSASSASNPNKLKCWGKPFYTSRYNAPLNVGPSTDLGHHQSSCLLGNNPSATRSPNATNRRNFTSWYIRQNFNDCANSYLNPASNSFVVDVAGHTIIKFSVANRHSCAVYENDTDQTHSVRCWGGESSTSTGSAQSLNLLLGIGGRYYGEGGPKLAQFVPILAEDPLNAGTYLPETILDIASSASGSCVLIAPTANSGETNNKIRCWGSNSVGQYGVGNTTSKNPAALSTTDNSAPSVADAPNTGAINFVKLYSGKENHTFCALDDENDLYCWGYNSGNGRLGSGGGSNIGDDELLTANKVVTAAGVLSMDIGADHMCAILISGEVQCWGYNGYGQLGVSSATANLLAPDSTKVPNLGYVP